MTYNFCTLFDKNYLTRGLALHSSLLTHAGDFTLWILCMDDETYHLLEKMNLPRVQLICMKDFEDPELLEVKKTRSAVEYCWTLTPSLPLYILKIRPELDHITYLDADTYFYSSPQPLYDEWKNDSVLIVRHNYSHQLEYKDKTSGPYNVEFLIFRNDERGREVLKWWRERCNEWCYFRAEDGKLGDQMYLKDWTTRFQGVRVLQHVGGGVAPWNVDSYSLEKKDGALLVDELPLVFYHYHSFRWFSEEKYLPSVGYYYTYTKQICALLYEPYRVALTAALKSVRLIDPNFRFGFHTPDRSFRNRLGIIFIWMRVHQFSLFLLCSSIFLIIFNQLVWPTSDEFFYSTIALAFQDALHGMQSWANIDTEHIAFVPLLGSFYNEIARPASILAARIPVIAFSIGTMAVLYAIAREMKILPARRMWFLWLLLLIPGFWLFSVKMMLDLPATFSIAVLVCVLIRKSKWYIVASAILLILVTKEYYMYLTIPMVIGLFAIDLLRERIHWWKKPFLFLGKSMLVYAPTICAMFLLLNFNILPYPRLLEVSVQQLFGDAFRYTSKIGLQFIAHTANIAATNEPTREPGSTVTIVGPGENNFSESLQNKIESIHFNGEVPTGIISPAVTEVGETTVAKKVWLIYKYNFAEADIHPLLLVFSTLGILLSIVRVWKNFRHHYPAIRGDLVMFFLTGIFFFFNFHEAGNIHGFRVTLPILISMVYFGYRGIEALLTARARWLIVLSVVLFITAMVGYYLQIQDVSYGSALSHSFIGVVLHYKVFLFMALFTIILLGLLFFKQIRIPLKYEIITATLLLLFALKFTPFYFDHAASIPYYSFEYGLPEATVTLSELGKQNKKIYSNIHPYKIQYYAMDHRIPNDEIFPSVREFTDIYPTLYVTYPSNDQLLNKIKSANVDYVFIVNDDYELDDIAEWEQRMSIHPIAFNKREEWRYNNHIQWVLYEVNKPAL